MSDHRFKIVITDLLFPGFDIEETILGPLDVEFYKEKLANEQDLIEAAKDADALMGIFFPVTRGAIVQMERMKIFSVWGVGTNHIDVKAASEKGIVVANVPDYCMDEVSSHAVSLILGCARQISQHDRLLQKGEWAYGSIPLTRFAGKTVGIVGLGAIGRSVAEKLAGFHVNVIGYDDYISQAVMESVHVKKVTFDELLAESDFISIHTPLTDETYHLFGETQFKQMKNSAYIVNTSRGGVIDENALREALDAGDIAGGGLDVFEKEPPAPEQGLIGHPKLTLTPHIGWKSGGAMNECREKAAEAVKAALTGEEPRSVVNKTDLKQQ